MSLRFDIAYSAHRTVGKPDELFGIVPFVPAFRALVFAALPFHEHRHREEFRVLFGPEPVREIGDPSLGSFGFVGVDPVVLGDEFLIESVIRPGFNSVGDLVRNVPHSADYVGRIWHACRGLRRKPRCNASGKGSEARWRLRTTLPGSFRTYEPLIYVSCDEPSHNIRLLIGHRITVIRKTTGNTMVLRIKL